MLNRLLKFNWISFLSILALVAIGVVFIKSAGEARTITALQDAWRIHTATALFGLIVYFTLAFIDYRKILDLLATPYFLTSLVLLVAVLAFGAEVYGGKRWLWFFQPSEIAKPAVILMIAKAFGRRDRPTGGFKDLDTMDMLWKTIRCGIWEAVIIILSILAINITVAIFFDRKGRLRKNKGTPEESGEIPV